MKYSLDTKVQSKFFTSGRKYFGASTGKCRSTQVDVLYVLKICCTYRGNCSVSESRLNELLLIYQKWNIEWYSSSLQTASEFHMPNLLVKRFGGGGRNVQFPILFQKVPNYFCHVLARSDQKWRIATGATQSLFFSCGKVQNHYASLCVGGGA